ncbi:hypothetical protein [Mycolicibacterium gadium]|uniref:hypothetical protein n=1 Tax=Mycolicibacterium gadium TaxID=1794 RepID=UPI002FDE2EEA
MNIRIALHPGAESLFGLPFVIDRTAGPALRPLAKAGPRRPDGLAAEGFVERPCGRPKCRT